MTINAVVFDAYGTLYDVQTVAAAAEKAFPGRGDYITQVWRLKQLEYSWLRSMMGRYEDFWTVTRDALAYTLGTLGMSRTQRGWTASHRPTIASDPTLRHDKHSPRWRTTSSRSCRTGAQACWPSWCANPALSAILTR